MADARPVIAILTQITDASFGVWNQPAVVLPAGYVSEVQRAGGVALTLTPDAYLIDHPDELLDRVDGVVLSGGGDIDPAAYHAERHPETSQVNPERDAFELALTRRAVERDLPVLGICRGIQVLNVAFGGTLLQHLPEHVGHGDHRRTAGSFDDNDHDVQLTDGSLAARSAGELQHGTKSHHHQGIDVLGDGLVATGISTLDDLVEALELPERRFVLGVQWHPEADERSRIIGALVRAAEQSRTQRALAPAA
jgi:putative glutamine amidotransferase